METPNNVVVVNDLVEEPDKELAELLKEFYLYPTHIQKQLNTVRATKMPGRNDQCDCGSGKKYKKCCLK